MSLNMGLKKRNENQILISRVYDPNVSYDRPIIYQAKEKVDRVINPDIKIGDSERTLDMVSDKKYNPGASGCEKSTPADICADYDHNTTINEQASVQDLFHLCGAFRAYFSSGNVASATAKWCEKHWGPYDDENDETVIDNEEDPINIRGESVWIDAYFENNGSKERFSVGIICAGREEIVKNGENGTTKVAQDVMGLGHCVTRYCIQDLDTWHPSLGYRERFDIEFNAFTRVRDPDYASPGILRFWAHRQYPAMKKLNQKRVMFVDNSAAQANTNVKSISLQARAQWLHPNHSNYNDYSSWRYITDLRYPEFRSKVDPSEYQRLHGEWWSDYSPNISKEEYEKLAYDIANSTYENMQETMHESGIAVNIDILDSLPSSMPVAQKNAWIAVAQSGLSYDQVQQNNSHDKTKIESTDRGFFNITVYPAYVPDQSNVTTNFLPGTYTFYVKSVPEESNGEMAKYFDHNQDSADRKVVTMDSSYETSAELTLPGWVGITQGEVGEMEVDSNADEIVF